MGLTKVQESCAKIQWYGIHKDADGVADETDDDVCLSRIKEALAEAKLDYHEVVKSSTPAACPTSVCIAFSYCICVASLGMSLGFRTGVRIGIGIGIDVHVDNLWCTKFHRDN